MTQPPQYRPEKFKGKGMPKPESILTISWEDVYSEFIERGIDPTKEMIEDAFDFAVENSDNECIMGAFRANVEFAVDENSSDFDDDDEEDDDEEEEESK